MGKVTLQDIADVVGVSRMTVSNAFSRPEKLSEALRETILATATDLGYGGPDPSARALARGRTGTVGLLLTDTLGDAFRDPVSTEFLVSVGDALAERSLALTLVPTTGEDSPLGGNLPMDGAIVYVCDPTRVDVAWLQRRGTPVVTVDQVPTPGVPAVNVDDASGARAAAQHLLDLGHRRIGIVTLAGESDVENQPAAQRGLGWGEVLRAGASTPSTCAPTSGPRPRRTTSPTSSWSAPTAPRPCSASPTSSPPRRCGPRPTSACVSRPTSRSWASTTRTSRPPSVPR